MISKIGVPFLQTLETVPQDPHIDYKWEDVKNPDEKYFIPAIGFTPIANSCIMINLWLKSEKKK